MGNTENGENKLIESQLLSMNSFQAIQYVLMTLSFMIFNVLIL